MRRNSLLARGGARRGPCTAPSPSPDPRGAAGRPRFFRPAHRAAAQAAGVMGARERVGTKTTGLPDLLVFRGVWYTVATDRAAAERLCTEGFS